MGKTKKTGTKTKTVKTHSPPKSDHADEGNKYKVLKAPAPKPAAPKKVAPSKSAAPRFKKIYQYTATTGGKNTKVTAKKLNLKPAPKSDYVDESNKSKVKKLVGKSSEAKGAKAVVSVKKGGNAKVAVKAKVVVKVTAAQKKKLLTMSKIPVSMKGYHGRNVSTEDTLAKLSAARDGYVTQGDGVATKVDDLVKRATKYAAELNAAGIKASATAAKAKKVSALWERIVSGTKKGTQTKKVSVKFSVAGKGKSAKKPTAKGIKSRVSVKARSGKKTAAPKKSAAKPKKSAAKPKKSSAKARVSVKTRGRTPMSKNAKEVDSAMKAARKLARE